jgi:predicted RNase H-like nuclease (RuvC/YqgF family)
MMMSQNIEYPRIETDSLGQKVVVMTIEQAQKLDNDSDLLNEFRKLGDANDIEKIAYIKIIDANEKVIASQKMEISKLNLTITGKDNEINELKNRLNEYSVNNSILNSKVKINEEIVDEKNKQLSKLKTKMVIGGIGGVLVITALVVSIIAN